MRVFPSWDQGSRSCFGAWHQGAHSGGTCFATILVETTDVVEAGVAGPAGVEHPVVSALTQRALPEGGTAAQRTVGDRTPHEGAPEETVVCLGVNCPARAGAYRSPWSSPGGFASN